jgi:hypothetical protein
MQQSQGLFVSKPLPGVKEYFFGVSNVVRCNSSSLRSGRIWMLGHKPNDVWQGYNSEGWPTRIEHNVLDKAQITSIEQNTALLSRGQSQLEVAPSY